MFSESDAVRLSHTFWHGRFSVTKQDGCAIFRDVLSGFTESRPAEEFSSLKCDARKMFREGFFRGAVLPGVPRVRDKPNGKDDFWFWQYPSITEKAAYSIHEGRIREGGEDLSYLDLYIGIPWATLIDKNVFSDPILSRLSTQSRGTRCMLDSIGIKLRLHTVCQHVYWERCIPLFQSLCITDVWLSHSPGLNDRAEFLHLHPWPLYAVNVEDSNRRIGLRIGVPTAEKKYLASFIGAHAAHYQTRHRVQLATLRSEPGFFIEIRDKWHYEDVVYGYQVGGRGQADATRNLDHMVQYNAVLSDSIFALCPAGAGLNTVRFWEALAIGAIPVILGDEFVYPEVRVEPPIVWSEIALTFREDIRLLPAFLRRIGTEEIERRSVMGRRAYDAVKGAACFKITASKN